MELKMEQIGKKERMLLIDILGIEPKCHSCGNKITEENIGSVFPDPNRVCCNNILCLSETLGD